jgi:hypothetical protein
LSDWGFSCIGITSCESKGTSLVKLQNNPKYNRTPCKRGAEMLPNPFQNRAQCMSFVIHSRLPLRTSEPWLKNALLILLRVSKLAKPAHSSDPTFQTLHSQTCFHISIRELGILIPSQLGRQKHEMEVSLRVL